MTISLHKTYVFCKSDHAHRGLGRRSKITKNLTSWFVDDPYRMHSACLDVSYNVLKYMISIFCRKNTSCRKEPTLRIEFPNRIRTNFAKSLIFHSKEYSIPDQTLHYVTFLQALHKSLRHSIARVRRNFRMKIGTVSVKDIWKKRKDQYRSTITHLNVNQLTYKY